MDFVGFYRIEGPFPFASAVVAISADDAATLGDCFLFVENQRNFIGFRRVKMPPGTSLGDAQARMREEIRRVHDKMGGAARRNGRLSPETALSGEPLFLDAPSDLVSHLWRRRGFADVLDWVGKTTASASLRAQIDKCRLQGLSVPN